MLALPWPLCTSGLQVKNVSERVPFPSECSDSSWLPLVIRQLSSVITVVGGGGREVTVPLFFASFWAIAQVTAHAG